MLLDEYEHVCTLLVPQRTETDEGGWNTVYSDGKTFKGHIAFDASSEERRAEHEDVESFYSVLIRQHVKLNYGDYFRDEMTGLTYRVTSIPDEKQTPQSATLDLKYFTAERREPPT